MMRDQTGQAVSRPILILGVVAAVLAVGALVFTFVAGRDTTDEPPLPGPGGVAAPPAAEPEPSPTPAPVEAEVFEIFEGRDPFRPLVTAGDGTEPAPDGGQVTPAPDDPAAPGATPAPTPIPRRDGVQVEVLSVAEDSSSATVRVGSTVHEGAQSGQTLSSGVQVVSIQGECVNFRRGSDSFRLCEGELTTK